MRFTQRDQNCVIATLIKFRESHVPPLFKHRFNDNVLATVAWGILNDLETLHTNQENTK